MCYPAEGFKDQFHAVDAGDYELEPMIAAFDPNSREFYLQGWFARNKIEPHCSFETMDPGFDGRFTRAPPGGCKT
jgi:hypothetical protein